MDSAERALRERVAYDQDGVWERSNAWNQRVLHVFHCANTLHGEQLFERALAEGARGGRVLDVGCGAGHSTRAVLEQGASYALGIDVAQSMIDAAIAEGVSDNLDFRLQSAHEPLEGVFDLIFGRSVLHHIDFREFLRRAYRENLSPGGRMLFMEPTSHPLTILFHRLVRSAHTPDEWPLGPRDLQFLRSEFASVQVHPINLVSFPAGVLSSLVFRTPENRLMRAADTIDRRLASRSRLDGYGRQAIIAIDKAA